MHLWKEFTSYLIRNCAIRDQRHQVEHRVHQNHDSLSSQPVIPGFEILAEDAERESWGDRKQVDRALHQDQESSGYLWVEGQESAGGAHGVVELKDWHCADLGGGASGQTVQRWLEPQQSGESWRQWDNLHDKYNRWLEVALDQLQARHWVWGCFHCTSAQRKCLWQNWIATWDYLQLAPG